MSILSASNPHADKKLLSLSICSLPNVLSFIIIVFNEVQSKKISLSLLSKSSSLYLFKPSTLSMINVFHLLQDSNNLPMPLSGLDSTGKCNRPAPVKSQYSIGVCSNIPVTSHELIIVLSVKGTVP